MKGGFLEKSVAACLQRRILVITFALMVSAAGLWAYFSMQVDAVPDISNIQVTVTSNARGLAPKEVEQYVTYPIELALQSVPKLKIMRSMSKYALSQVTAVFEDGTDIYWARQQVAERLKSAESQMPRGADVSTSLGPIATGLGEVYQFELRGKGYSLMQLRDILDWQIIPALKTVPGVDEVQSMGGDAKEYQVWLDPERLHGFHISTKEITDALSNNNANAGGGYTVERSDQILLRAEGMLTNVDEIGDVVVRRTDSGVVKVRDLGKVVIGKKLSQSIVTHDGVGETVIGIVVMRKGENSKEVVDRVRQKVDSIQRELPQNTEIVPFYDRSELINRTIETVWDNLSHGALFVLIVLFVLLASIGGGVIAALAIPLALFGALIFLRASGTSANLLSLGAIDFGILIDGSVVMVENILKRLAHDGGKSSRLKTVSSAAAEMASPVFFAVLIITVVYFPIFGLPGVSGKTFHPMAMTVVFGLITALIVALYLTPSMCYYLLGRNPKENDSFVLKLIRRPFRLALVSCVRHPYVTLAGSLLVFICSLLCLPMLGSEFVPVLKEGSLVLTVNRPVSGSLMTAAKQTTLIEKTIRQIPEVERVVSRTGHSEIAFDPMGPDETDVFVIMKPPEKWRANFTQQMIEDDLARSLRSSLPGLIFSMSQPIEQRMNELVAGAKSDVAIRIFGSDLKKLREMGLKIAQVVSKVSGARDLKAEQTAGLPVVTAKINSKALAAYGVSAQDVLDTVSTAVDGKIVGTIYEGRPRYDLTVRFEPDAMEKAEDIASLPVPMASGELVPLGQLAIIERSEDAAQIAHVQGTRNFTVQVNVRGRDLGSFVQEAQRSVARDIVLPPGYHIEWGGQFENMIEAQSRLLVLIPAALVLIFVLLYILYNEAKPGLLIFANIPLAFSGGIFALLIRDMHLSVTSGVGFIALFGVAVLNGVVLVSTIRSLQNESGMNPRQAAICGANARLRPVLMTALVASLGFVPMAMASSVGAEVQRPLATVVIGGLMSSTVLTLLVLPSLYPLLMRVRRVKIRAQHRADSNNELTRI